KQAVRKLYQVVSAAAGEERQDSEPWYWGYLVQGGAVLGLLPIFIPIVVAQAKGPAAVGLVVAVFYIGQIFSPVFGSLADRSGRYGLFFLASFGLLGLGALGFVLSSSVIAWSGFALLQGIGAGIANTVAYAFIVEFRPKDEWDGRLGWLQTFYGTGQAIGLLIAAALQGDGVAGLYICAAAMIPGVLLGRAGLPRPGRECQSRAGPVSHDLPAGSHARSPAALLRHYEHLGFGQLAAVRHQWVSAFGLYMLSWFMLMLGTWVIYNLYPLLMKSSFGVSSGLSSLYYGIAATLGIFLYAPSGDWAKVYGSARIVLLGIVMTAVSIFSLVALLYVPEKLQSILVAPAIMLLPIAWSPMIVAGTALAGRLSTIPQGTTMGLYNAATAAASVLAALMAGQIAELFSYNATLWFSAAATAVGIALFLPLLRKGSHLRK
ncbi:MFS transporter, partial [Roseibium sp. RKSG952]|uniref:MFS transporter n=1 Tax=Roseibium sp. RKSG952 TaxID=2529384 RepID=UPI0012BB7B71